MFYPAVPHTLKGWLLFASVAPPVFASVMFVAHRVGISEFWNSVSDRFSPWARVTLGVIVGSMLLVLVWWAARLLGWQRV
jgi:hypothetical protein